MAVTARPISPTIHSRPIVGVEKRVRTIDGMPERNASSTPTTPAPNAIHPADTPSYNVSDPTTYATTPAAVQNRGTPVCTSTAKHTIDTTSRATPHQCTGSTA